MGLTLLNKCGTKREGCVDDLKKLRSASGAILSACPSFRAKPEPPNGGCLEFTANTLCDTHFEKQ